MMIDCYWCRGKGTVTHACGTCRGSGKLPDGVAATILARATELDAVGNHLSAIELRWAAKLVLGEVPRG